MRMGRGVFGCLAALMLMAILPGVARSQDIPGVGPAQSATAKTNMRSAQLLVVGQAGDDKQLISDIQSFMATDPTNSVQDGSFNFAAGVAWLKKRYAGNGFGIEIVGNAFSDIYGRAPYPEERIAWLAKINAQQAWYQSIVNAERKRMNGDPFARHQMLERAFIRMFGRVDEVADQAFWLPRQDSFVEVCNIARDFIYARPNEIDTMVRRALNSQFMNVDEASFVQWRAKAVQGQWSFARLTAEFSKR